jgi:hypothetical protein
MQKFIDDREFRRLNKWYRNKDLDNLRVELKREEEFIKKKKTLRNFRLLFRERKNRIKLSEEERKQRKRDYMKTYYQENKAVMKYKARKYDLNNKEKVSERKRNYRSQKLEYFKAKDLERYYKNRDEIRQKQNQRYQLKKAFALMGFENKQEKACKAKISISPPTSLLSELLRYEALHINKS